MNHDPRDCSTEDEGVDEDMMFEFEEELTARLSLHDGEGAAASRARSPFADASALPSTQPARPTNPVAAVLQSANDAEDAAFASLSTSPFCAGGLASSAASAALLDKSPSFDFNGRRKRKYFDDSCCVTPRVRPLAKRAKSFSCVGDILLPDCGFKSICSTGLTPTSIATEPSAPAATVTAATTRGLFQPAHNFMSSSSSSSSLSSSSRSKSIQIPHRERASAAHRSAALHLQRSSSGPARGSSAYAHVSKTLDVPAASSDPLTTQASSSWNASVEYFCRRSLDISSPLRNRFRDLVVGSVGRAGGLKSP